MFKTKNKKRVITEPHSEIFTPSNVVLYMIDSVESVLGHGLTFDDRILEPSAGDGAFILSIVRRMYEKNTSLDWNEDKVSKSITAFEINLNLVEKLRCSVHHLLLELGCDDLRARELACIWIQAGDFLEWNSNDNFDAVLGNPPYIRYDAIDREEVNLLQKQYSTFKGRCDLYVPFIEKALTLLAPHGVFCFICSNRFTKSEYGKGLRRFIYNNYHVSLYLNLEHANVFGNGITAYPSIFLIDCHKGKPTYTATVSSLENMYLDTLRLGKSASLSVFTEWYQDDEPWATTNPYAWHKFKQVQSKLPLLVESAKGTQFGIGVATGNDDVFINRTTVSEVESDCLLPLVTSDDIRSGRINGQAILVNPWNMDGSGKLQDLSKKPGLAKYLERYRDKLEKRYIAQRSSWYRTIDRVDSKLFHTPKIVLPDLQSGGVVGIDEKGSVYPHHNVYWIISTEWPLRLLAAILKSDFVTQQIRWASTEMRGGCIRFQVKNLERLRIPSRSDIDREEEDTLVTAYMNNDIEIINAVVNDIVNRCLQTKVDNKKALRQLLLDFEA